MKEKYPAEVSCPECGTPIRFDIWTHIDSDLNIEETYELMSGTFFKHVCPCCGKGINVFHSLGFIDPRSRTIINYVQTDESDEKKMDYVRKFNEFFAREGVDIKSKVVFAPDEFVECVRKVRFAYASLPQRKQAAV